MNASTSVFSTIHLSPELIWHPVFSIINRLHTFSPYDERLNDAEIDYQGNWLQTFDNYKGPII